jgi:hypothetical protein
VFGQVNDKSAITYWLNGSTWASSSHESCCMVAHKPCS